MKITLVDDEQTELDHLSKLILNRLSFLGNALKIDTFPNRTAFLVALPVMNLPAKAMRSMPIIICASPLQKKEL